MRSYTLEVNDLYAHYLTRFGDKVYSVDGVSLRLERGKILGIAGESGCGKSTLANCLMGCFFKPLHFASGSLIIDGIDAIQAPPEVFRKQVLGQRIAYIPQAAMNTLNPTIKIKTFLLDVLKEHKPEMSKAQMLKLAVERFEALGLNPRVLEAYPNELSGGMKQRTVIAISTILNPKVLIADEPTSALDVTSQKKVILLIKRLLLEGYVESIVFITHELPLLYHVADQIAVMYAGQFVEVGGQKDLVFNGIHPYTKALMGSIIVPELDIKSQKLLAIPGAPPNLKNKLTGCRFYERCQERQDRCKRENPPMKTVNRQGQPHQHRCLLAEGDL